MATYRSLSDLANTTQNELLPGIIDVLKKNDEFTAALVANAKVTDRPTLQFNRLATAGGASWVNCDSTITSEAISASKVTYDLETIVRQFDVCTTGQNLYSSFTDVAASEMEGAIKAMSEEIAAKAISGASGGDNIVGLDNQVVNSFAVETSGAFDVTDLDRLYDETLSRGNLVYIGAPATVRTVMKDLRNEGAGAEYMQLAGTELRVPSYLGYPILRNQWVGSGVMYMVDLDQFNLYFGETEDMNAGVFSVENIGSLETKLAKRMRVYAHLAAVLLDTQGASKLTGVA